MSDPYAEMEKTLPPVFARTEVPRLFGNLISVGRLANLDSEGKGPRTIRIGRKTGYTRKDFIEWISNRNV